MLQFFYNAYHIGGKNLSCWKLLSTIKFDNNELGYNEQISSQIGHFSAQTNPVINKPTIKRAKMADRYNQVWRYNIHIENFIGGNLVEFLIRN